MLEEKRASERMMDEVEPGLGSRCARSKGCQLRLGK